MIVFMTNIASFDITRTNVIMQLTIPDFLSGRQIFCELDSSHKGLVTHLLYQMVSSICALTQAS